MLEQISNCLCKANVNAWVKKIPENAVNGVEVEEVAESYRLFCNPGQGNPYGNKTIATTMQKEDFDLMEIIMTVLYLLKLILIYIRHTAALSNMHQLYVTMICHGAKTSKYPKRSKFN